MPITKKPKKVLSSTEAPPLEASITQSRVWYQESRTINLGNFNSIKIETGVAVSIQEGEMTWSAQQRCTQPVIQLLDIREDVIRKEYRLSSRKHPAPSTKVPKKKKKMKPYADEPSY